MTIFTFSFDRNAPSLRWMMALIAVLAGAMLLTWTTSPGNVDQPVAPDTTIPSQARNALRTRLQSNFDRATRGAASQASKMMVMPHDNSAGLICNPATLDRNRSTLRMVLPALPDDRKGVLAALAPDGSLRIIYVSYGFDVDPEDLVIPYSTIDWQRVRTRNDFVVDVGKFEAIRPDADRSEALFQQPGIYQFALLNSIDRERLDVSGAPFWVIAGCVVRYQP